MRPYQVPSTQITRVGAGWTGEQPEVAWRSPPAGRDARAVQFTGEPRFDVDHVVLVERLAVLTQAADDVFGSELEALRRAFAEHFADEDAELLRLGSEENRCHLDEHAAVLASLAEVQGLVLQGNVNVGRRLCRELQRWLPRHVEELDTRLARMLFKARTGGSPLHLLSAIAHRELA